MKKTKDEFCWEEMVWKIKNLKNISISKEKREQEIDIFLSQLKELWKTCPEQRFAQLLFNYTKMGTSINEKEGPSFGLKDFFYYEDKMILEDIKKNTEENIKKIKNKKE